MFDNKLMFYLRQYTNYKNSEFENYYTFCLHMSFLFSFTVIFQQLNLFRLQTCFRIIEQKSKKKNVLLKLNRIVQTLKISTFYDTKY